MCTYKEAYLSCFDMKSNLPSLISFGGFTLIWDYLVTLKL